MAKRGSHPVMTKAGYKVLGKVFHQEWLPWKWRCCAITLVSYSVDRVLLLETPLLILFLLLGIEPRDLLT